MRWFLVSSHSRPFLWKFHQVAAAGASFLAEKFIWNSQVIDWFKGESTWNIMKPWFFLWNWGFPAIFSLKPIQWTRCVKIHSSSQYLLIPRSFCLYLGSAKAHISPSSMTLRQSNIWGGKKRPHVVLPKPGSSCFFSGNHPKSVASFRLVNYWRSASGYLT